jgi:SRSO17 transposase
MLSDKAAIKVIFGAGDEEGALIIDDTGVLKPYAKRTEGVAYQHCPVLGTEALCNVAVASCYSVNDRYIPLEVKFYKTESEFIMGKNDPDFKSKLELAKELIDDALHKKIPFRYCPQYQKNCQILKGTALFKTA